MADEEDVETVAEEVKDKVEDRNGEEIRSLNVEGDYKQLEQNVPGFHPLHLEIPLAPSTSQESHVDPNPPKFEQDSSRDMSKSTYVSVPLTIYPTYPLGGMKPIRYSPDIVINALEDQEVLRTNMRLFSKYSGGGECLPSTSKAPDQVLLPTYVHQFNENTESTDKYFSGIYNWYYTGGILHIINDTVGLELPCLYMAFADTQNSLGVAVLSMYPQGWNAENIRHLDMRDDGPIMEINSHERSEGLIYFLVRQKHAVSVIELDTSLLELRNCFSRGSLEPYVSGFLSRQNGVLKVFTLDVLKRVNIYFALSNAPAVQMSGLLKLEVDHFGRLCPVTEETFLIGDRKSLLLYDFRSGTAVLKLYNAKTAVLECDYMTNICRSPYMEHGIYLTTYHTAKRLDMRHFGFLNSWTHNFKSPPLTMDTIRYNDADYLCLASQLAHEKVILGEKLNDVTFLHKELPTMSETLFDVQMQGFIQANDHNIERVRFSNVGMRFVNSDFQLHALGCNVLGDIFLCDMRPYEADPLSQSSLSEKVAEWVRKVPPTRVPIHVTNVVDLADCLIALNVPEPPLVAAETRRRIMAEVEEDNSTESYEDIPLDDDDDDDKENEGKVMPKQKEKRPATADKSTDTNFLKKAKVTRGVQTDIEKPKFEFRFSCPAAISSEKICKHPLVQDLARPWDLEGSVPEPQPLPEDEDATDKVVEWLRQQEDEEEEMPQNKEEEVAEKQEEESEKNE